MPAASEEDVVTTELVPTEEDDSKSEPETWFDVAYCVAFLLSLIAHIALLAVLAFVVLDERAVEKPFFTVVDLDDELETGATEFEMVADVPETASAEGADPSVLDVTQLIEVPATVPEPGISTGGDGADTSDGTGDGRGNSLGVMQKRLEREGAKSGAIQISLMWHNGNDLDLHVRCPSGEIISYRNKDSQCRGELDVDMNASGKVSLEPVENIYWPLNVAPDGQFQVFVHHYRNRGFRDPTLFQVAVNVSGTVRVLRGVARQGQSPVPITTFHHPMTRKEIARAKSAHKTTLAKSERAAAALMSRAREYLKSRPQQARPILQRIVREYPGTETARVAASLLAKTTPSAGDQ